MTSESQLDIVKTMETTPNNEASNVLTISIEDTAMPRTVEEKINIEKPKRPRRKKKELTSTSSLKDEDSNALDSQPLFEQPIIVEGKRSRKPTLRLELSDLEAPKKELSIPEGHGKPLGEIEYIDYQITNASPDVLSRMRNICFGRRASHNDIRENLREFKGFEFEHGSDEYQRHLSSLIKLKKDHLKSVIDILGLSAVGRHNEHAERILNFLMNPVDDGKKIPERKTSMRSANKTRTNSKQSIPTDEDDHEFEEKSVNGDDDHDEFFYDDDQDDDDEGETDDDYIGSDGESGLNSKDDPDDFAYQPGKKTPKKKSPMKRTRKATGNKRKKGNSTPSKRGRKKTKTTVAEKIENVYHVIGPAEPMLTNSDGIQKSNEDNGTPITPEIKHNSINTIDAKLPEKTDTTMNNTVTEIVPTTN